LTEIEKNVFETPVEYKFNMENTRFSLFANPVFPRDKYVKLYSHSFFVIIFVTRGIARVTVENDEFLINAGDAVVVASDVKHGIAFENHETEACCISFSYSKNSLDDSNDLYAKIKKALPDKSLYIKGKNLLIELIQKCFASINDGNKYVIAASFYNMLVGLMDECGLSKSESVIDELFPDGDISRLHKINTLANVYYDRKISVDEIAKLLFLSTRQVNRIIQSYFGCAWRELIIQKRMTVAVDLLKTTDMTIEEISVYVGYESVRGFYSAFKKYFEKSPSEYR